MVEAVPGVTVVNLFISPAGRKVMYVQKDTAKGSVHNRANDFQRTLTAAEYTEDYVYRFSQDALTIHIHFLARVRNAELNGEVFDWTSTIRGSLPSTFSIG